MLFGNRSLFAIECEITDASRSYFFGRIRIWIGDRPFGDFSGEIISTYVFEFERILQGLGQGLLDCSGRLPYMETLHWQIMSLQDGGHRIQASTGKIIESEFVSSKTDHLIVELAGDELPRTMTEFIAWMRSQPGFLE